MKNIIAFLLSAVILLTLCSCGKNGAENSDKGNDSVPTTPYEITFEDVKDGYIKHANKGMFLVEADADYQCTDNFYVFLPVGSVVSSEKEFALLCYDSEFVLDTTTTKSSGQEMDKLDPIWEAGSRTISVDTFVRVSVKGKITDIKVGVPDNVKELVSFGSKEALVNMPIITTTSTYFGGREQAVNYIFITDIHYNTSESEDLLYQVKLATEMANNIDAIDFIVVGGDTTTGMFETKEEAITTTQTALAPLKDCKKPVFVLMGNHDDNSYHRFTYDVYYPERIVSDKDWNDNIIKEFCPDEIVKDKNYKDSKYYYYDLADKKTRVICLDALDYRAKYNSKGVISELPIKDASATEHVAKYWSGCSWWGYSEEQIKWLATEALTADSDWDYIFLSHMGIDTDTNCYNYKTLGGTELRSLIKAYQNRTEFRLGDLSKSYAGVSGRITSYQFGHVHTELTLFDKELKLWQISTATASKRNNSTKSLSESNITNKTYDWNILNREADDEAKYCFDIMSVDKTSVHKYAYGAGTDEKMTY